ncbi:MAG: hypothetical protein RLZZ450_1518 [Pseudomonadota bacterium]
MTHGDPRHLALPAIVVCIALLLTGASTFGCRAESNPEALRQHAVDTATKFYNATRRGDASSLSASIKSPLIVRGPASEVAELPEQRFTAAELPAFLAFVHKQKLIVEILDSKDDFPTELLSPDLAKIVAPTMPKDIRGRIPVVTSLSSNGFSSHWVYLVGPEGVEELWVKNFFESN